ncbi:MAG: septum formation initiator family protein [Candidatus Sungbacteria bacterium]|uniref:Septum formation initiator family protein n=1 Tax=Candidatus Sungiibacteriota bacterium TaxID=2750080 RepID=A0A931YD43_9BACT|nr:septum formation initiator family protein [Candidatus Sungbacteria bacterium]MBI2465669.1 septum formation initiator family protein [Candidatus Sungbacteria bacterium]
MRPGELATVLKKKWLGLSLLALFVLILGYLGLREFWRWWAINREYKNIQEEIVKLDARTGELKKELEDLSEPVAMEKEAKARLNLKREGESVLIVVSEDNFPEENFFTSESQGLLTPLKSWLLAKLNNPESIWFNLNNWKTYFFP